jgi:uncharacterized membrane protein YdjX (TVP38/TMEM64 family)
LRLLAAEIYQIILARPALAVPELAKVAASVEVLRRMEPLKKLLAHRNVRIGLVLLLVAAAVCGWLAWKAGVDLAGLKAGWEQVNAYLVKNPWALFLALVVLPGLPVPTSLLLLTAGVVWRERPLMACALCLLALALNLSWTYWLAAGPARRVVEKLLATTAIQIPELPRGDHLKLILVMRLTPGIPLFFQNYLLGFLRAPFYLYLPISLLCTGVIGSGVVLSGAGLADGKLKWAITGVSLIVLGGVLTHLLRGWLGKRKAKAA